MSAPTDATVLVAAAGRGVRFGSAQPKQLYEFCDTTLLDLVLGGYQAVPEVSAAVVVAHPDDLPTCQRIADSYAKVRAVVPGGSTRQLSIMAGLAQVRTPWVIIHDAAYPVVRAATVQACLSHLEAGLKAVVATWPTSVTTVTLTPDNHLAAVCPRGGAHEVQAPLAFCTDTIRDSYQQAYDAGQQDVVAETVLLAARGDILIGRVEGSADAFKLTWPADEHRLRALINRNSISHLLAT